MQTTQALKRRYRFAAEAEAATATRRRGHRLSQYSNLGGIKMHRKPSGSVAGVMLADHLTNVVVLSKRSLYSDLIAVGADRVEPVD